MSRENVELVRRAHEAFNRRDTEAYFEVFDSDGVLVPLLAMLEGVVYRGREEIMRWFDEVDRNWAEFQTTPQEFRDLGEVVLVFGTWHARSRTGDLMLDSQPGAWVAHMRDGKVVRHETFTNRAEALEAVGLSE